MHKTWKESIISHFISSIYLSRYLFIYLLMNNFSLFRECNISWWACLLEFLWGLYIPEQRVTALPLEYWHLVSRSLVPKNRKTAFKSDSFNYKTTRSRPRRIFMSRAHNNLRKRFKFHSKNDFKLLWMSKWSMNKEYIDKKKSICTIIFKY